MFFLVGWVQPSYVGDRPREVASHRYFSQPPSLPSANGQRPSNQKTILSFKKSIPPIPIGAPGGMSTAGGAWNLSGSDLNAEICESANNILAFLSGAALPAAES